MQIKLPDTRYLQECFRYEADTGKLFWRSRPVTHFKRGFSFNRWNATHAGKEITNLGGGKKPYIRVGLNKTIFLAHRIIFKLLHNYEPVFVDHIDGNTLNNKPENLRAATSSINNKNRGMPCTNTSGVTGVSWNTKEKKWRACISINNKTKHLGRYDSLEEAKKAYVSAKHRYGFHENHGQDRNQISGVTK